jgi:hypothetical protein
MYETPRNAFVKKKQNTYLTSASSPSNLDAHAATTIVSGALPDVFAKLQDLEVFRVSGTHIGGPLPPSIFTPKLRELGLANNDFESTIPETIGAATSLSVLVRKPHATGRSFPLMLSIPSLSLSLSLCIDP